MFKWVLAMGIGLLLAACQSHDKLELPTIEPVITPILLKKPHKIGLLLLP